MKKFSAILLCTTMAFSAGQVLAKGKSKTTEITWAAEGVQYKEVVPNVSQAVLWGNPGKGAYGALTKFAAGSKHGLHTHLHDIKLVVIKGTLLYGPENGVKSYGPGSYVLIPGGHEHISGATMDGEVLMFEESAGKFTMTPVVAKKK